MVNVLGKLIAKMLLLEKNTNKKPSIPLEKEFLKEVRKRKEANSERLWSSYYIPLATAAIVKENGRITPNDNFKLECLANSLMFKDMADGKIDELYKLK